MSNCERTEEQLIDFIDGSLDEPASELVQAHLASCDVCSETLRSYRGISAAYRAHPETDVDPRIADRLLKNAADELSSTDPRPFPRWIAVCVAAAALILAWTSGWLFNEPELEATDVFTERLIDSDQYLRKGQFAEALLILETAQREAVTEQERATIRHHLGTAHLAMENYAETVFVLDAFVDEFPNYANRKDVLIKRAEALARLGEAGQAIQAYQLVVAEFPDDRTSVENRITALETAIFGSRDNEPATLQALGYVGD